MKLNKKATLKESIDTKDYEKILNYARIEFSSISSDDDIFLLAREIEQSKLCDLLLLYVYSGSYTVVSKLTGKDISNTKKKIDDEINRIIAKLSNK
jgi:regulator of sigma D